MLLMNSLAFGWLRTHMV